MLKLDVYAYDEKTGRTSQNEVAKTVTAQPYDIMFGTVEDILGLLDAVNSDDDSAIIGAVVDNWEKLTVLMLDVFPDLEPTDVRNIKVRDVVPVMVELFKYVIASFGGGEDSKNK